MIRNKSIKETTPFGIYIHWPYCISKCPYCDFYSQVRKDINQENIIDDYIKELNFYHQLTSTETVSSIFFGGGTPSLISPLLIEKIINHIIKTWHTQKNIEISLEANPNTDKKNLFKDLKRAGINRLSLGVQALNEQDLRFLGRTHSLTDALKSIDTVLQTFENHSMDLIYARPEQKLSTWEKELEQAANFGFKHLSLYQLTIEEGTTFAKKQIQTLDEQTARQLFNFTNNYLKKQNYKHYEVSNYAQPQYESKHNLLYWQGDNYIGIGPSAHGRIKTQTHIYATTYRCNLEELTPEERAEELLITGLRLKQGITYDNFEKKCGIKLEQVINPTQKQELERLKFIRSTSNKIYLTRKGLPVMNTILQELIR